MYRVRVPAKFGRVVPRRGALSIVAGVKIEELEVALTEIITESKREMRAMGDLVKVAILTISLKWTS